MLTLNQPVAKYPGVYRAEVVRVRCNKGTIFVKAKVLAFSYEYEDVKYDWVTTWAPVALPFAGTDTETGRLYGAWFSPRVGDQCLISFEQGLQGHPMCIGFLPHVDDMPPEFDNDEYTEKSREEENREQEEDVYPAVNEAAMLKTGLLYLLFHQKKNRLVLDAATGDGAEDPRIELGENATETGFEVGLGRRGWEQFLKHEHEGGGGKVTEIDYDDIEDYISEFVFINQKPREDGKTTTKEVEIDVEKLVQNLKSFAEGFCKAITTADEFMDDPVGTIVDGVSEAIDDAATGALKGLDTEQMKSDVSVFMSDLDTKATDAGKSALNEFVGQDGALGSLIGGDASAALSGAVGGMDLGGISGFANDAYGSLKGLAEDAGVMDAIDDLGADALGAALDKGVEAVKGKVTDAIGDAVGSVIGDAGLDVPFVDSALNIASGICSGNMADTVKGLFGAAIDGLNALTGGLLTPFTAGIKSIGSGLIDGLFTNEAEDGATQVERGRE